MTAGTLEATQTGAHTYQVEVIPDRGIPVILYVVPIGGRWYLKRSPDPKEIGFISHHTTFERAAQSANSRAKRYLASYARTERRRKKEGVGVPTPRKGNHAT